VLGIFKIRSLKLFAWAGFEPWSSWSLLPKWLGLQACVTSTRMVAFFLIIANMTVMRWNLNNVLICISFMAKDVEIFFMYLLVIDTSLENCSIHLLIY
jgi:hypothetical protein